MSENNHDNRYLLATTVVEIWAEHDLEHLVEFARDQLIKNYAENPQHFKLDWDWAFEEEEEMK